MGGSFGAALDITLAYHERSKHRPFSFAPALGYLDWDTQPDPFRRFEGAPVLPLDLLRVGREPRYEPAFTPGLIAPAPLDRLSISRLFHDALALSAWKQAGRARWALRVNPSSGNLHPTEGYLVAGPIAGLHPRPAVFHYAPLERALELRAELSEDAWLKTAAQLPERAVLVGLTSMAFWFTGAFEQPSLEVSDSALALRHVIHQRRSAVALDGRTGITRSVFYQILSKVMPGSRQIPFTTLPWRPSVDLLLFVHRVADLTPGLYVVLRDPARREALERAMDGAFVWTRAVYHFTMGALVDDPRLQTYPPSQHLARAEDRDDPGEGRFWQEQDSARSATCGSSLRSR